MIIRKNNHALSIMREAGKRLAHVFEEIPALLKARITTRDLDSFLERALERGWVTFRM